MEYMSNCKSPILIITNNAYNKCVNKCMLEYSYSLAEPFVNITNYTNYLQIDFPPNNNNVVKLDDESYDLSHMMIYSPSIHQFGSNVNGAIQSDGEIQLYHTNKSSNSAPLIISVMFSMNSNGSNNIGLNNIIDICSLHLENTTSTYSTIIPELNINSFIGQTPYFTYTGSVLNSCNTNAYYIVYNPSTFSILISQDYLNRLHNVIQASNIQPLNNIPYFINDKGPSFASNSNEIYIDCNPVDTSDTTQKITVPYLDNSNSSSISMILQFIYITLFLLLLFAIITGVLTGIDYAAGYRVSLRSIRS